MKRKIRIYKYRCDTCGWEALRGDIISARVCSKCGSTKPPFITTEDAIYEIEKDSIRKAKMYVERLIDGEDPEELDKEIGREGTGVRAEMACLRPALLWGIVHSTDGPNEGVY